MVPKLIAHNLGGAVRLKPPILTLITLLGCAISQPLWSQAPPLAWTTNLGARLFAVDAQTNVYVNVSSNVIQLTPSGVPIQTNTICPVPGIARRDSAGNFWFGGLFDGTQNFGGITLVGGYIEMSSFPPFWRPGYPSCYLAKYGSGGALQWVVSFGQMAGTNHLMDLLLDPSGGCYVGWLRAYGSGEAGTVSHFTGSGSNEWQFPIDNAGQLSTGVTLGGLTSSNCCFLDFRTPASPGQLAGGRISIAGNWSYFGGPYAFEWVSQNSTNGKPLIDDLAQALAVGVCAADPNCTGQVLRKFAPDGTTVWSIGVGAEEQWTLARDVQPYIYLAGANGLFAKYDTDGVMIWSTNYGQKAFDMIVDSSGNRFVSFANGAVARIGSEPPPQSPGIVTPPAAKTIFVGDDVTLSVTADGTPPLRYCWRFNGTNLANATSSSFTINSATEAQAGFYSVLVTNVAGSITSSPVLLRVRSVAIFQGTQQLTNGTYLYLSPTTFSIHSAYTNGSTFYTLDGSTPDFNSTYYTGPFTLSQSATIRAIGYSADFFQSEEADTVNALVIVNHTLTTSTAGGGSISLSPPGGTYPNTNIITATANPALGWMFLYWLGDAAGTNASVSISMERNKFIYAVFGTTLSTTVAGNGQILLSPPGGVYPYGSAVRLTGLSQPGSYFGFWGNAAVGNGNTNPTQFTITSPTQTVSSIFGTLSSTQAALTVLISGSGHVNVNPRANAYPTNQSVILTAAPDAGQSFLNWSGDASGTLNPLTVFMTASKVITANFSGPRLLRVDRPGTGLTPDGFRFSVLSDPGLTFQILGSSNLTYWEVLGTVHNTYDESQFTDSGAVNHAARYYKAAQLP